MEIGMIGLGRMGANMVRRLIDRGHSCVVYDIDAQAVRALEGAGATGADSVEDLTRRLSPPRVVWMMVPAAVVPAALEDLVPHLEAGDVVVDGGNSYYQHDIDRARDLAAKGVEYMDVGVSGGVHGLERGYCLMAGGSETAFRSLEPVLADLAPGVEGAPRSPGRTGEPSPEERGYLHCGGPGAGHFVKMVHNGIENGMMAAYAEGFNLLHHAGTGREHRERDAETAPMHGPEYYDFDIPLDRVAELWRRGSVIPSWLLDLTAAALHASPGLSEFQGRVSDSGEGRWTIQAGVDTATPLPVLAAALFSRFASRGEDTFAGRVLSAMRKGFGGHGERPGGDRA